MTPEQRKKALGAIWRTTHKDFKGKFEDGTRSIMTYRNGTCLVALENLTDEEVMDKLRKADREFIFGVQA